jgi:transporter family-2 protein
MNVWAIVCAVAAGFCTAVEQTINGRLGREISPSLATLHNLTLGAILFFLINLFSGNLADYRKIAAINPVLLTGGIFGAMIIYLATRAVPALGVTVTLTLIIAGQLTCGIVADIFVNKITFNVTDWVGIVLVIAGVFIIIK